MAKVILHVGLPKTATTTIQKHLLYNLHKKNKINYLGKLISKDSRGDSIHVLSESYQIRSYIDGSTEEKPNLHYLLREELINVISDEGILCFYPGKFNLSIKDKLLRIKDLFKDHDLKIVISLRESSDYIQSLYFQLYPEYYVFDTELNTFSKFKEHLLKADKYILHEYFDIGYVVKCLEENFSIDILFYEDLKYGNSDFYIGLNNAFEIEGSLEYLTGKSENVQSKLGGKVRKKIGFDELVSYLVRKINNSSVIYVFLKYIYRMFVFMNLDKVLPRININNIDSATVSELQEIRIITQIQNKTICDAFPNYKSKLESYNYIESTTN
ncbi:hypothetical protein AB4381_12150 [Vibrio splendidus]